MEFNPTPPEDKTAKRKRFIINFLYFILIFGLSILFVRYALPHLWAFVIAFFVVLLLRKPAQFLHDRWKFEYKTASVILVLLFYATIGLAVTFLLIGAVQKIGGYLQSLSEAMKAFLNTGSAQSSSSIISSGIVNSSGVTSSAAGSSGIVESSSIVNSSGIIESIETGKGVIESFETRIEEIISTLFNVKLKLSLSDALSSAISSLTGILADFSKSLLSKTTNIALSFSTVIINIFVCIVSTAFGLMDYDMITGWFKNQLSEKRWNFVKKVSTSLGLLIWKYIVSYGLILLITFAELSAGLGIILRDEKAFLYAGIIAVFDILPIIGSGLFLFPWSVICMFTGSIGKGIGLLVLWIILSIVRNIIEPRIVGKSVGLHPLVTLFAMIAGKFIYGGIGILLCPVTVSLLHTLNTVGLIHLYKVSPRAEEPQRTAIGRFFDMVADWVSKPFVWLYKLIFRKKPRTVEAEIQVLHDVGTASIHAEIPDEVLNGSPEASGSGPRPYAPAPEKPKKKKKNK